MASLGKVFDKDVEGSFDLIEAGWYTGQIVKAEVKKTKAGTGSYLNCQYKIDGPKMAGRVVFGMLTISNPNPVSEEMGEQQMTRLRAALGIKALKDTDQLLNKRLEFKVKVKEDKNEVADWKAVAGSSIPTGLAMPSQLPTNASAPPWAAAVAPEQEIF